MPQATLQIDCKSLHMGDVVEANCIGWMKGIYGLPERRVFVCTRICDNHQEPDPIAEFQLQLKGMLHNCPNKINNKCKGLKCCE